MPSIRRSLGGWSALALAVAAGVAGCEPIEPENQLRFSPSGLSVSVGGSREFTGIVTVGTPSGTWFVQPTSITIAQVEVTGPLTARLTCSQQGAGTFVLSTLTSQGQISGSIYFVCTL
jgi:hypothetical protein